MRNLEMWHCTSYSLTLMIQAVAYCTSLRVELSRKCRLNFFQFFLSKGEYKMILSLSFLLRFSSATSIIDFISSIVTYIDSNRKKAFLFYPTSWFRDFMVWSILSLRDKIHPHTRTRSSISVIVTAGFYPERDESLCDIGIAASSFALLKKADTPRSNP